MNPLIAAMYDRLADFFIKNLELSAGSVILEAGCGRGQLTIPFAKKLAGILEEFKIVALDVSSGPYKDALSILEERALQESLEGFIVAIKGDVRNIGCVDDESVDAVISNELFCDLDRKGLEKALEEFFRILKPGGQMAHGELNPVPENPAQQLLIVADSHPTETLEPEYEWFSPFSDEVATLTHRLGFRDIVVKYVETDVRLSLGDAVEQLERWKIDSQFLREHIDELRKHGLEFPMEHVIFCRK